MAGIDTELFTFALENLKGRQARSFLTILGIIIGIGAIVALVSIGEGLRENVSQQFDTLGTDTITVLPGANIIESVFSKLKEDDVKTVEKVRGVDFAAAIYLSSSQLEYHDEKITATIVGIDPEKLDDLGFIGIAKVEEGRILTENDSGSIVIGHKFGEKILKEEIALRQNITIEGKKFRVVGILEDAKNSFGAMFNTAVAMSSDELKEISGTEITPFRIIVEILPSEDMEEMKQRISDALEDEHGKKDFLVMDLGQVAEIAASVVGMITLVLGGIAFISLLVGGIGIMNTMLMSVMERTKEIGVMKAIGATNRKIISIFVMEAGIIGLVGGAIGLFLGIGLAAVLGIASEAAGLGLTPSVPIWLIALALSFSMAVGMIAGVYPAVKAASVDPVEALRYE
jgi:putative ABC transport system permease protein